MSRPEESGKGFGFGKGSPSLNLSWNPPEPLELAMDIRRDPLERTLAVVKLIREILVIAALVFVLVGSVGFVKNLNDLSNDLQPSPTAPAGTDLGEDTRTRDEFMRDCLAENWTQEQCEEWSPAN